MVHVYRGPASPTNYYYYFCSLPPIALHVSRPTIAPPLPPIAPFKKKLKIKKKLLKY